ncbi:MAG: GAF and ANTAR domain-containing protein [Actinobacteria bacterium]|nr:GAF and ANTAR domain-containing protein [Actinomycetota bacterium]
MSAMDTGIDQLTIAVASMSGLLVSHEAAAAAVEKLAQVARDMVPSAVGAGASLMDDKGSRISTATTDRIAMIADELQYELGQGPCISAWATSSVQRLDDTESDTIWSRWSSGARDLGIRSVLSAPLVFRGDVIGALKVYSTSVSAFDEDDERRLVLLSAAAATLLGVASGPEAPRKLSETLAAALSARNAVETATGILMERHQMDLEAARYRLIELSRTSAEPLADVARSVLDRSSDTSR